MFKIGDKILIKAFNQYWDGPGVINSTCATDGFYRVRSDRTGNIGEFSEEYLVLVEENKSLTDKVFGYLTVDGHAQRKQALRHLVETGWFTSETPEKDLNDYLKENPHKFCAGGIGRFRDAVGVFEPKPDVVEVSIRIQRNDGGGMDLGIYKRSVELAIRDAYPIEKHTIDFSARYVEQINGDC